MWILTWTGVGFRMRKWWSVSACLLATACAGYGVRLTSMCRQIQGTDTKIGEEIMATKGRAAIVGKDGSILLGESV